MTGYSHEPEDIQHADTLREVLEKDIRTAGELSRWASMSGTELEVLEAVVNQTIETVPLKVALGEKVGVASFLALQTGLDGAGQLAMREGQRQVIRFLKALASGQVLSELQQQLRLMDDNPNPGDQDV